MSLAHNGVLFLDELAEFRRATLDTLRQPLEDGHVTVARHRGVCRMPARFQLVGALNPCPCGRTGLPKARCACTPGQVRAYLGRVSGPLLDRIDLHVPVPAATFDEMSGPSGEATAVVRSRVARARRRQAARAEPGNSRCSNALLPMSRIRSQTRLGPECERLLRQAVDRLSLSARSLDRVLRVARTISDLSD